MNIEEIKVKLEELPEFVINKIVTILQEYDVEFNQAETIKFDKCPKCGKVHPHIIKGRKTKGGTQMYRCKDCNARFTSDYGFITFGSRLSKEVWNDKKNCNEKKTVEDSWFKRGNILIICGRRNSDTFLPKTYANTRWKHTVRLVTDIKDNGDIVCKTERVKL